ncbi:MAG: cation:proton antiporter [Gemmataceae bacterium]
MASKLPSHHLSAPTSSWVAVGIGYVLMLAITVVGFLLVQSYGETLTARTSQAVEAVGPPREAGDIFLRVLIALAAIVIAGQILGRLFVLVSQPPVIGEVIAGILLGPSFLGAEYSAYLLPAEVAPYLSVIAQLGVVLYMFLVGLELNPALLKQRAHAAVAISHASILFPFLLGATLALYFYPRLADASVPFTSFALFLGVAMSITAFPVLARILTDYGMSRTRLGTLAVSCAAIDDVTAWCLLAFVVGVARAQAGTGMVVAASAAAFIAFMLLVGRPLLEWAALWWEIRHRAQGPSTGPASLIFIALLLSASTAEAIGIHAIFGAFLLGAVIPHDSAAARVLTGQLEDLVRILLLPAFFALTGMRTRIDLLVEPGQWALCGLVIFTATAGKFGGTLLAARLVGLGWRDAAILGTLMNTRGLMELIVLNVGLDLGVISPALFAMMVLMALATTMLTAPVVKLLYRAEAGAEL